MQCGIIAVLTERTNIKLKAVKCARKLLVAAQLKTIQNSFQAKVGEAHTMPINMGTLTEYTPPGIRARDRAKQRKVCKITCKARHYHSVGSESTRTYYVCSCIMYGHTYSKSMDQPGKVANPASGQLNRGENGYFPVRVRA